MKNNPIGIFDSGIGGLTIANAIKKVLPNENIIYFGDTEHLPYGEKSKEAIQNFSRKIISFLRSEGCKIIVIACNSASSVADESITKNSYGLPIINVIDPVVKEVIKKYANQKIGVIGTKATIKSNVYRRKITESSKNLNVLTLATPLLAPMIEEKFINQKISKTIITKYLSNKALNGINHLILACTHYPLIQKEIKKYYQGKVNIIDPSNIIAEHIKKVIEEKELLNIAKSTEHHFHVSNYTRSFEKSAKLFFKESVKLKETKLFNL